MLSLIIGSQLSFGADCDVNVLKKKVTDETSETAAGAYAILAGCDAKAASRLTAGLYKKLIPSQKAYAANKATIELGQSKYVTDWIQSLQSDSRASAIGSLSQSCTTNEAIQNFFVQQSTSLGDEFWEQRWYRSLGDCQVEPIQQILSDRLDEGLSIGRSQYFNVLEVYSRNAESSAMGQLKKSFALSIENNDEELQINTIMAFSDAAQVSGSGVGNQKTALKAGKFIRLSADKLGPKALAQARLTLQQLGNEEAADELVNYVFADLHQEDESFLWGLVLVQNTTCKNGKERQQIHTAKIVDETRRTWPDQLQSAAEATATAQWEINLADSCRGEGENLFLVPDAPFADTAAFETWVTGVIKEHKRNDLKKKVLVLEEDPIQF
jgi:hypothetical protein